MIIFPNHLRRLNQVRLVGFVFGALLIHAAYPLYILTEVWACNYLLTSAGVGLCFISLSRNGLLGRIANIVGILQLGYTLIFGYNLLIKLYGKEYHFKVSIWIFILIIALCTVILCLRSALKHS